MTREIKFRAWDQENQKMVEQEEGISGSNGFISLVEFQVGYSEGFKPKNTDDLVFMQFTGLKYEDKKEICESDIIKDNVGRIWVVGFDKGSFVFEFVRNRSQKQNFDKFLKIQKPLVYVGNIHQNPELLGGKQ